MAPLFRPLAAGLALVLLSHAALAQSRPALGRLTCAQARALVEARGEVIFDTGPYTFLAFVRDASFCPRGDTTEPAFGATADNPQCLVGYNCRSVFSHPRGGGQ